MSRLYFAVRADLSEGRRAAQLLHAMDLWTEQHGAQRGTVIVYEVPNELALKACLPADGRTVVFHEPDLGGEATAFATDQGPMALPLLGSRKKLSASRRQYGEGTSGVSVPSS